MPDVEVEIPYAPRLLQKDYHEKRTRFGVLVCHRRFGKTTMVVNEKIKRALTCPKPQPRVAYIAPTYTQAKRIAWDAAKHFSGPIPGHKVNEAELRIDYPNGGRLQLLGADNPDSLRGAYYDDVACDEYQLWHPRVFAEILRPALADREGGATFVGTPAGVLNPLREIWERAQADGWYCRIHKASETGYVPSAELEDARKQMSVEQYAQEFECSWESAIVGAIYASLLRKAEEEKRTRAVPIDPTVPVDTAWDLGISDATSIWFFQRVGFETRLVDYYEARGEALQHYVGVIEQKARERDYRIGRAILPHDAEARELGTGRSRKEILQSLRLSCEVAPRLSIADGIEATRQLLKTAYFDAERCKAGLLSLWHYRREYNDTLRNFYDKPVHDWASHAADALRMLAVSANRLESPANWAPIRYPDNAFRGVV